MNQLVGRFYQSSKTDPVRNLKDRRPKRASSHMRYRPIDSDPWPGFSTPPSSTHGEDFATKYCILLLRSSAPIWLWTGPSLGRRNSFKCLPSQVTKANDILLQKRVSQFQGWPNGRRRSRYGSAGARLSVAVKKILLLIPGYFAAVKRILVGGGRNISN